MWTPPQRALTGLIRPDAHEQRGKRAIEPIYPRVRLRESLVADIGAKGKLGRSPRRDRGTRSSGRKQVKVATATLAQAAPRQLEIARPLRRWTQSQEPRRRPQT